MMDWKAIYQARILPILGVKRGGVSSPRFIFVCGQPGSGKSTTINRLMDDLGPDQTQLICIDRMADLIPEIFADDADPAADLHAETFQTMARKAYVDALFAHAASLKAHVIWERAFPSEAISLGLAARALGFRVECVVLAVPADESWLAVLTRETSRAGEAGRVPSRVRWARLKETFHRWPAFLARAEDQCAFDEIRVTNRDGEVLFENRLVPDVDPARWENPPFAFESLVAERLHQRSPVQLARLIDTWEAVRAHPDLAFVNHDAWPWVSITALGDHLMAQRDDPATGFDLNDPAQSSSEAALGWIARLRADLTAAAESPEAEGLKTLAPRADRLLALVAQIAGQPTR